MKPSVKVKITSNRNKNKNFSSSQAAKIGYKITRDLAKNRALQNTLAVNIPKRNPKFAGLQVKADITRAELTLTVPSPVPTTFEEKVEAAVSGDSWVGDTQEFVEAVRKRLEGRAERGPSLHEAVGDFVERNITYKKRKSDTIKRSIGSELSIK